jgi:hypothetical protein
MLTLSTVGRVESLLAEGLAQRAVARHTGVSRRSVCAIASGEWRRLYAERQARKPTKKERQTPPCQQGPQRCPSCGGLVHMPCRACQIRKMRAAPITTQAEPILLDLRGRDRMRYEQLRIKRGLVEAT